MAGEIRSFDYVVGLETSTPPTDSDPSSGSGLITLTYADEHYTPLSKIWGSVATISALRAILSTDDDRTDDQVTIVVGTGASYYWDSTSTATDDGDAVVKPTDNPVTGRWLKFSSGGGGGGGTGGSSLENLMQKLESEKYGILTDDLDNSVGVAGRFQETQMQFIAYLLRSAAASATTLQMVINPKVVNDADPNYDSTSGWSAVNAGNNLTATSTSGEFYTGTAALKFDKDNSSTRAAIQYDRGTQTFSVGANTRVYAKVKLPSTTQLSNVLLRMYAGSTSDYREFTASLQSNGSALQVGENLVFWDLTSGGTPSGAGWTSQQQSRYQEVGVNTAAAGQTYTGIIFDSLFFSYKSPEDLGIIGSKWTLHDNSNSEGIIFDSSNTKHDGLLTLASALTNTYAGGVSGASVAILRRSTMLIESDVIAMDNSLSGAASLSQDLRLGTFLRGNVSGTARSFMDFIAVQNYKVTAVGGSTIDVRDDSDDHLNLLSGDTIEVYRPLKIDGKVKYYFLFARSLSTNSSASAGTTTLTMTTTSILVGDVVCKRHVASKKVSLVGIAPNNEAFSSMMLENDPDGVQLVESGIKRANPTSVFADWLVGAQSEVLALENQLGIAPALTKNGTPNLFDSGPFGEYAASNFTTSNYLSIAHADALPLGANSTKVQMSLWMKSTAFTGSSRLPIGKESASNGWVLQFADSANTFLLTTDGANRSAAAAFTPGKWFHVFFKLVNGGTQSTFWVDGTQIGSVFNTPITVVTIPFIIGCVDGAAATGQCVYNVSAQVDGADLTAAQILELSKRPRARLMQRYVHKLAGQSGQKLSDELTVSRSTVAITPKLYKAGLMIA